MSATDVLRIIEEVWREIPYPGEERLIPRPKQPKGACRDEHDYVADFFAGKHWRDLDKAAIIQGYEGPPDACLTFMAPEAYRYFLPAFMKMAVLEYEPGDTMCQAALSSLVPPSFDPKLYELAKLPGMTDATNPCSEANVKGRRIWWEARVAGFTPEQRGAIVVFLEHLNRTHGRDYAYDSSGPAAALKHWKPGAG